MANPFLLGALARFFQVEQASRYAHKAGRVEQRGGAGKGDETAPLWGIERHAHLSVDLKIAAPTIYVSAYNVYKPGRKGAAGSVLVLRLGQLSICDDPADAEALAAEWEDSHANRRNKYVVEVESMGVDLLRDVDLSEENIAAQASTRASIVRDLRMRAHVALSVAQVKSRPDSCQIQVVLPVVSVAADQNTLCELMLIAGSWANKQNQQEARQRHLCQAPVVGGWVLTNGLAAQTGWCWRWLVLTSTALELRRSGPGGKCVEAGDQICRLDAWLAATEVCAGTRVIALQPLPGTTSAGSARLLLFAGRHHFSSLEKIWLAQRRLDPARDWRAGDFDLQMHLLPDTITAFSGGSRSPSCALPRLTPHSPRAPQGSKRPSPWKEKAQHKPHLPHEPATPRPEQRPSIWRREARGEHNAHHPHGLPEPDLARRQSCVHVRLVMDRMHLAVSDRQEQPIAELTVSRMIGSVSSEQQVSRSRFDVGEIDIITPGRNGGTPYHVFGRLKAPSSARPSTAAPSDALDPCLSLSMVSEGCADSMVDVNVKLPERCEVNVDPYTAAIVTDLVAQLSASFANQIDAQMQHLQQEKAPLDVLSVDAVPPTFFEQMKTAKASVKKRTSLSIFAAELHVQLRDHAHQQIASLNMLQVLVNKIAYCDASIELTATLGALQVQDRTAASSLYPNVFTVSQAENELVEVRVHSIDATSIGPAQDCTNQFHVSIDRPQITVLFRFISTLMHYQEAFTNTSLPAANVATPEDRSLLNAKLECSLANDPSRAARRPHENCIFINLKHPQLTVPRNSLAHEAWIFDFGNIMCEISRNCLVVLENARVDTVEVLEAASTTRRSFSILNHINGSARITSGSKTLVSIDLDSLKGTITDVQYALLMSILDENFNEHLIGQDHSEPTSCSLPEGAGLSVSAAAHGISDRMRAVFQKLKDCAQHASSPPLLVELKILDIELAFDVTKPSRGGCVSGTKNTLPFSVARAKNICVTYAAYGNSFDFLPGAEEETGEGLISEICANFSRFEVLDSRSASSNLISKLSIDMLGQGSGHSADTESAVSTVLVRYLLSSRGHSLVELRPGHIDLTSDIGFLSSLGTWFASRNVCHCGRASEGHSCAQSGFEYVRQQARDKTSGMLVEIEIASSSIHLVTLLDDVDSPGFDMKGGIRLCFAMSSVQDQLQVQVDRLVLKLRESGDRLWNITQRSGIDELVSCGAQVTYHRNHALDSADSLTVAVSRLECMLTYELAMLGVRVNTCLMDSIAHQIDPYMGALSCSDQDAAAPAALQTTSNAKSDALSVPAKSDLLLTVNGAALGATLVDDFAGRWVPLLRVGLQQLRVGGPSSELETNLVGFGIEYFHAPSSSWKTFKEDSTLTLRVVNKASSQMQVEIQAQDQVLLHVSQAVLDSLTLAQTAWSQDKRTWYDKDTSPSHANLKSDSTFVPYIVHNLLHEPLVCMTEDGTVHRVGSQQILELSYEQVWNRSWGLQSMLHKTHQNHLQLYLDTATGIRSNNLGSVSIEVETRGMLEVESQHSDADCLAGRPPVVVAYEVYRHNGQKCLRLSSMVMLRNHTACTLACEMRHEAGSGRRSEAPFRTLLPAFEEVGVPVPLDLATDGIVCMRPVVPETEMEFEWCDEASQAVHLSQVNAGLFRETQMVDFSFQRNFGALLPPDATLLHAYKCANDVPGKGLREGVLFVTDRYLCHSSSVFGDAINSVIPFSAIVQLKKTNTAIVIPNAIRVKTRDRKYWFRTLRNRGETFREILKVLPDKSVVTYDDDIDDAARDIFQLEPSDHILEMHPGSWHHDPGNHAGPRIPGFTDGKILFSTNHLMFLANGDEGVLASESKVQARRKVAWSEVRNIERRRSGLIFNNAVLISTDSDSLFLSSGTWKRDKAIDRMSVLCRSGDDERSMAFSEGQEGGDDGQSFGHVAVGCRQITVLRRKQAFDEPRDYGYAKSPKVHDTLGDETLHRLARSSATLSQAFHVLILDAKTKGHIRPGRPCVIELHPPWIVENSTCHTLEVEMIDKIRGMIASVTLLQGASQEVLALDQRRPLRLRARLVRGLSGAEQRGPWSNVTKFYSNKVLQELRGQDWEGQLHVPEMAGNYSQSVEVEVKMNQASGGFCVCLYDKFWLLNLSGLALESQSGMGWDQPRALPLGMPVSWDGDGDGIKIRVPDVSGWSSFFTVSSEESVTLKLSRGVRQGHELYLEASAGSGVGRYDRTIIVSIEPTILIANCLGDGADVVIWQRSGRDLGSRMTVAVGQTLPFHAEGRRDRCWLSVNLAADGMVDSCVSFVAEMGWGLSGIAASTGVARRVGASCGTYGFPIVLRLSRGRMVIASLELHRTNTVLLTISDMGASAPHCICNHSGLTLAFRQAGDDNDQNRPTDHDNRTHSRLILVEPGQQVPIVWPEPSGLPHRLILTQMNGMPLASTTEIDAHELGASTNAFEEYDNTPFGTAVCPCPAHMDHDDFQAAQREALTLKFSTRLSADGRKIVHVHTTLLKRMSPKVRAPGLNLSVRLPALNLLLEDSSLDGEREVLFLSVSGIRFGLVSDPFAAMQHVTAEIRALQVDNQFDGGTPFPVVLSIEPSSGPAISLQVLQTFDHEEQGSHRFYDMISLEVGEGFVFVEDLLLMRIQQFLAGLGRALGGPNADRLAVVAGEAPVPGWAQQSAIEQDAWKQLRHGVAPDVAELRARVVGASTQTNEERGVRGVERSQDTTTKSKDPFMHVKRLELGEVKLHLTLVVLDGALVRQVAGATIERMVRDVKLDDVVVTVMPQQQQALMLRQSVFAGLVTESIVKGFRKSFASGKLVLKALDAWSDHVLRVEEHQGTHATQRAGLVELHRRRPLGALQDAASARLEIREDRWGMGRMVGGLVGGVTRLAGRTLKSSFTGRFLHSD